MPIDEGLSQLNIEPKTEVSLEDISPNIEDLTGIINTSELEIKPPTLTKIDKFISKEIKIENENESVTYEGVFGPLEVKREYEYRYNTCTISIKGLALINKYKIIETTKRKWFSKKTVKKIKKKRIWYNYEDITASAFHLFHGTINKGDSSKSRFGRYKQYLTDQANNNDKVLTSKLMSLIFDPLEEQIEEYYNKQAEKEKDFLNEYARRNNNESK
jgi:hypothetical protein